MMIDLDALQRECHEIAVEKGFWDLPDANLGEKLCLVHAEISEALEELRKGNPSYYGYYRADGKPEGFGYELADAVIRIFDLAEHEEIPLGDYIREKLEFNKTRPVMHGKRF